MALGNKYLSDLSQIETIADADILLINDESEASEAQSKYVSISQLKALFQQFSPTATPRGEMYIDANPTFTTISAANTYYLVNLFSEGLYNGITFSAASRLTVDEGYDGVYNLLANFAVYKALSGTDTIQITLFKNGVEQSRYTSYSVLIAGDTVAFTIAGHIELAADDYLEIYIKNITSDDDLRVVGANVNIHGI